MSAESGLDSLFPSPSLLMAVISINQAIGSLASEVSRQKQQVCDFTACSLIQGYEVEMIFIQQLI